MQECLEIGEQDTFVNGPSVDHSDGPTTCAGSFQRRRSSPSILTVFTMTRVISIRPMRTYRNDGLARDHLGENTTLLRSPHLGMGRRSAQERTWHIWRCGCCSAGCCGVFASQRHLGLFMRVGTQRSRIGTLHTVMHFWSVYRSGSEFSRAKIGVPATS